MSARKAYVVGVGMTAFTKPADRDYPILGLEASVKALIDASLTYDDIEYAAAGYVYGDSTCGQRVLYQLGMTGIPIVNVNNNCSTGSSAFNLAANAVLAAQAECALAVGFEKMAPGSLSSAFTDRAAPMEGTMSQLFEIEGDKQYEVEDFGPFAARIFGAAGLEYCEKYGATWDHIAEIAAKNHAHSANNPYAQFRATPTKEQVAKARKITREVTLPMCSPTSDGGAAVIVASEAFVKKHGLEDRAIELAGMGVATDSVRLYEDRSRIELAGADMSRRAAQIAYKQAGIGPKDVQVLELHDCFAPNELVTYPALGLCAEGDAHKLVEQKLNTYNDAGKGWVVNPSGGLESKGHPLGATGLGMIKYMVDQLRGDAGALQVKNVQNALTHNIGLGGSCVVTILRRPSFYKAGVTNSAKRFGYNAGDNVKSITEDDLNKVKSKQFSDYLPADL
ncbi:probable sterol carrier protein [Sporisorium reilianum SRZ2]|uniref:Probable sterol carrier protein n=2 Tax=Sporisorium reilianum TaxID=72558 RepID=E6ZYB8_SPORE|nr:probable sterol carrier protein [Sporisorium reilianum SRZ2]SJX62097.1 probable sterol carrier protein [Sporisorium reilianum f. sp. reilianum]